MAPTAFSYSYDLPSTLIARRPANPRDSSKLFVYDTAADTVVIDRFANLGDHLPPHALLVLNDTKVVPARVELQKATGGRVEALFLMNEWRGTGPIPTIVNREIIVGAALSLGRGRTFTVVRQDEQRFYLKPHFPARELFTTLQKRGSTPIPKYIKGGGLRESELRRKYQSVFAARSASVAAPTASLHFTDRLIRTLAAQGVHRTFVTLDVGLGTFAPLRKKNMENGTLHTERFTMPQAAARAIRKQRTVGSPIVAVGTTVVRTLESAAPAILHAPTGRVQPQSVNSETQIFIRPPHHFRLVDAMITNFHLPETSLMMLVQAFLQEKRARRTLVELYAVAIEKRFRFYSFGDAMLIK